MSLSRILANIGTALDSASTGDFLSKVDSDGVFGGVAYSSVTGTPTVLDSANITNLVDSAYIQLRQSAVASGGLDSAGVTAILDSDYITGITTASGFQMFEYDATAGQTEFTGSDVNGNTLAYSEYGLLVHYNGILLSGATDYTATDGTTVVLTDSADADARITIAKWSLASAGGAGGSAGIAWGGDRALVGGGNYSLTDIEYFDITTTGGTADFGDLLLNHSDGGEASDGTYGLFIGGYGSNVSNAIDYVTIATPSNSSDFGDLNEVKYLNGALSNGTYALSFGGYNGSSPLYSNTIEYVTIASPSNSSDFGDLTQGSWAGNGAADNTRGVLNLGQVSGPSILNNIDYVTVASPSNTTDFGDLTMARKQSPAVGDGTYVIWSGGEIDGSGNKTNTIDYVVVQTTGNATDFGDSTIVRTNACGASNDTRAIFASGYTNINLNDIDYITMATPSNATDFGDLTTARNSAGALSGSPS